MSSLPPTANGSPAALALLLAVGMLVPSAAPADDGQRLRQLFDREWHWRLAENPLLATAVGGHDFDDRLPAESLADQARRAAATKGFLAELGTIDRVGLAEDDRVNYDLFAAQLHDRHDAFEFGEYALAVNADSGFHSDFAQLPMQVPLATVRDYENYLARLRALPTYFAQTTELMRDGVTRSMTPPRVTMKGVEATISIHLVAKPEQSVFWAPFAKFPAPFPEADRTRLAATARQAIAEDVIPAYRRFLDFMTREYLPGCRPTLAAADLPRGKDYYRFLVQRYSTLELTPEEIHRLGVERVAAIRSEMEAVIRRTGFQGNFAAFLQFLRTDPRFYAKTPEELLDKATVLAKRMDAKLPSLFGRLPRQPYGVMAVPAHLAPKYTAGRYSPSPRDGTEPGWYWVNTYALDTRPLYNLEALTFHEAVPGHHLQGALAEEAENVPEFRRHTYISAFGEGWGLYSEWLGLEAGFYTDPYSNFGRLTYAMWRACRLVVDTGVHALGWNRQRVLDYLAENTALSLHEIETETDRYISWPGQALSYALGEMKIRELRARAERELGSRFDVRAFHDVVLGQGAVPLPVLERQVERWLASVEGS